MPVERGEPAEHTHVLAQGHEDAGPGPDHRTDRRHESERDEEAHDLPSPRAQDCVGRDVADFYLTGESRHGGGVEEDEVEQEVERRHDEGSADQRKRDAARGISDLAGHVDRGVPARVGVGHVDQRHREWRREQRAQITRLRPEVDGLGRGQKQRPNDESGDEQELERREEALEPAAHADAVEVHAGNRQHSDEGGGGRVGPGENARQVLSQRHRGGRDRRRESDRDGDPAGQKPDSGVVDARQILVLAA